MAGEVKVVTNFAAFATKLYAYSGSLDSSQRATYRRSAERMDRRLEQAKANHSTTGRLNRVGRSGGALTINKKVIGDTYIQWSPNSLWGLIDSSLNGRPSKAHTIAVRRKKKLLFRIPNARGSNEPRPLKEATPGPVFHPGATRRAEWRRAVRMGQNNVVETHKREFYRSIANGFGR